MSEKEPRAASERGFRFLALVCAFSIFLFSIFIAPAACAAQEIIATPQKTGGVYRIGEQIQWRLEVRGPGREAATAAHYVLKKNGITLFGEGAVDLTSGSGVLQTSLDEPGTVLAHITAAVPGREIQTLVGAAVAPEKIQPSAPTPVDFDDFWQKKVEELLAIPANTQAEPADSGKPSVDYWRIRLDNIHGTHVYGQLARPRGEGKFPAMLILQYAGVYGLPKSNVVVRAESGWLALNIMAHDLPFDEQPAFYEKSGRTTLSNYPSIGCDDREKSYFLRMLLRCYRAADFLTRRPEWDGKTLVVTGTSQGGLQAFATAALFPRITSMMVNVPAGCDTTGTLVGRASGWPHWENFATGDQRKKVLEVSEYFDAVNFASRVKCPALVGVGLIDETSPPAGVFAAFNELRGPKEVLVMERSDHHGSHNSQAGYIARSEAWAKALLAGQAVPPN